MLSLRYITRLITAFIGRFKGVILIGIVFGIVFFVVTKIFFSSYEPKYTERIGLVGRYKVETLPLSIMNLISDGLTKLNIKGLPESGLAASWESQDSGKVWIFKLRNNINWQDGKKLISSTINYQFSDAKIEMPNDNTLKFTLQNSFAPFPEVVSRPVFRKGLLGTGVWKVTKASIAGNYVESLTLMDKNKNRKVYKFYPTEERAKLAFRLGQIDSLQGIVNKDIFSKWNTINIKEEINANRMVVLFFNTQDSKLSEKTFRQALAYGIDKNFGNATRALSPLSSNSWAYNPQVKQYNFDPTRTKKLINGLPKESTQNLSIKLVTIPALLSLAEKIAKNWESIGVKTIVQVSSGIPNEFQAFLAIFDVPSDPDQYSVWHSTQTTTNISHYKNPRIDKLLEDGRTQLNQEERKKIYLDFQRFLIEDSPAVFLYNPIFYTINRK